MYQGPLFIVFLDAVIGMVDGRFSQCAAYFRSLYCTKFAFHGLKGKTHLQKKCKIYLNGVAKKSVGSNEQV